jgi:hypothetical protein
MKALCELLRFLNSFLAFLANAETVLDCAVAASISPLEVLPPTAPNRRVVVDEDILGVHALLLDLRRALDPSPLVVLDIALVGRDLRILERVRFDSILRTVLLQQHLLLRFFLLNVLLCFALSRNLACCGVGLQVQLVLVAALLRLPSIGLRSLKFRSITRGTLETIFGYQLVGAVGCIEHRSGLWVVFRAVKIQVEKVLGRILS